MTSSTIGAGPAPQPVQVPAHPDQARLPPKRQIRRSATSPAIGSLLIRPVVGSLWHDGVLASAAANRATTILGRDGTVATVHGGLIVHLREHRPHRIHDVMHRMAVALSVDPLPVGVDADVRCDVGAGWSPVLAGDAAAAQENAERYAQESLRRNDLVVQPVLPGDGALEDPLAPAGWMTGAQVLFSVALCLLLPMAVLVIGDLRGWDLARGLYWTVVTAVAVTAALQLTETALALRTWEPPPLPAGKLPPATAVIAAYLPNEATTIVATVRAFLELTYAGPLQIVLAYNTPSPLPVEDELRELARRDVRLAIVRVEGSTSKAQNVNAVLGVATGEFIGIYDADHHPMPGAFERAWRWLADSADVVQGHCVVRNGDASLVARLVAVEFEQIYAVGHAGRQKLHGFGVFGGSSGFWRTAVLREIRLRSDRLTEDIDASVRALRAGYRIVNDRGLISRELAPVTLSALWKQRIRWAQGWHEVSRYHWRGVTSGELTRRQRLGLSQLLVWRETYVWATPLIWVLLAFEVWHAGSVSSASPALIALTIIVLLCGPLQLLAAYRLADASVRHHRSWWWSYLLLNLLCYQELKNLIARVAQLKHAVGERQWTVTPRSEANHPAAPDSAT